MLQATTGLLSVLKSGAGADADRFLDRPVPLGLTVNADTAPNIPASHMVAHLSMTWKTMTYVPSCFVGTLHSMSCSGCIDKGYCDFVSHGFFCCAQIVFAGKEEQGPPRH